MTMKPDMAEGMVFLPERILGKPGSALKDEKVSGEYGLVINGNSLVRGLFYLFIYLHKNNKFF